GGTFAATGFDASVPLTGSLPTLISAATYAGPANVVDLHFDNFSTSAFGSGTLLTMNLQIPANFPAGSVVITPQVDTVAGEVGGQPALIPTSNGSALTLNVVVPEPGTLLLLAAGAAVALGRRKRV
ncbi:MAG: PEP-CTERM sorting domain-containing protein, partial [Phycisphaerae bacterium]